MTIFTLIFNEKVIIFRYTERYLVLFGAILSLILLAFYSKNLVPLRKFPDFPGGLLAHFFFVLPDFPDALYFQVCERYQLAIFSGADKIDK